ncbi:MAG: ribosome maturation factor RimM [Candidatus Methylomirabilales bacterium]
MATQKLLVLGRVLGAWGVQGAVKVKSFTQTPDLFFPGQPVILRGPREESEVLLEQVWPLRNFLRVRFQGINNRNAAEAVRGYEVCIPRVLAPPLPEATYYHYDILGLKVQTETGKVLGEIVDIWPSGAHDLYVVRRDDREWLLPAVRAFILRVDPARGVMIFRPVEGLVDAETV